MRNFSGKLSCLYSLLCYIYHLRTRDLRTKVGDTSEVIFHRYDGIFLRFIIEPLFLIKVARLDFLRGQKYFENISDIWKKCVILDLCLFMFEKYIHPEELKLAFIFLYF